MKRLSRKDGVGRGVGQARRLAAAVAVDWAWHAGRHWFRLRAATHVGIRVDADDAQPTRGEQPRRDAGAAADVDQRGARLQRAMREDEVDCRRRIVRPALRIDIGQARETFNGVRPLIAHAGTIWKSRGKRLHWSGPPAPEVPMLRAAFVAALLSMSLIIPANADDPKLPLLFQDDFEKGAE